MKDRKKTESSIILFSREGHLTFHLLVGFFVIAATTRESYSIELKIGEIKN